MASGRLKVSTQKNWCTSGIVNSLKTEWPWVQLNQSGVGSNTKLIDVVSVKALIFIEKSNNEGLGCETPSIHNRLQQVTNSWNCHWAMLFWWQCRWLASESIYTLPEWKEELYQRWCSSECQCGVMWVEPRYSAKLKGQCNQAAPSAGELLGHCRSPEGWCWQCCGWTEVIGKLGAYEFSFLNGKVEVINTNC